MAKACYVGVGGKARKVKKIYTGVSDVARKVKKGYVGVGGVARPFYSAEQKLVYYGKAAGLTGAIPGQVAGRLDLSATTVGNYALFGGGEDVNATSKRVDAYSDTLVRSTPTELSEVRTSPGAGSVGNYALFGGGWFDRSASATADAYSNTLVRSTPTALGNSCNKPAVATVGNYVLFGGGGSDAGSRAAVTAYSDTLVRSMPTALSTARDNLAATTVGNHALFGGGETLSAVVDAYSDALVRSTPTALSEGRNSLAATTVGNYALFGGGYLYKDDPRPTHFATVDAYSDTLVRSTPTELSSMRGEIAATTVGEYALFVGGKVLPFGAGSPQKLKTVDAYSSTLVRSTPTELDEGHASQAATTVGNYALFGGGNGTSDFYSASVYVYTVT